MKERVARKLMATNPSSRGHHTRLGPSTNNDKNKSEGSNSCSSPVPYDGESSDPVLTFPRFLSGALI